MAKLIFLPGASGRKAMWDPWIASLGRDYSTAVIGWPGLDNEPINPGIHEVSDLSQLVFSQIEPQSVLIAQSMGGVVALHTLLKQKQSVSALVLCATSGGLNRAEFDCEDWRPGLTKSNPDIPLWFIKYDQDLSDLWKSISIPVLLIWGSDDRISPVSMGERLNRLIPNSKFVVVNGADHDVAETHSGQLVPDVSNFLRSVFG